MKSLLSISLAAIAVLVVSGCSRERDEYFNGRAFAKQDLGKGQINIAAVEGGIAPFYTYSELLRQRYHIGCVTFSLPGNPAAAEAWVRGYNEVMIPKIERRFGTNILKETLAEAQKMHDATARH